MVIQNTNYTSYGKYVIKIYGAINILMNEIWSKADLGMKLTYTKMLCEVWLEKDFFKNIALKEDRTSVFQNKTEIELYKY